MVRRATASRSVISAVANSEPRRDRRLSAMPSNRRNGMRQAQKRASCSARRAGAPTTAASAARGSSIGSIRRRKRRRGRRARPGYRGEQLDALADVLDAGAARPRRIASAGDAGVLPLPSARGSQPGWRSRSPARSARNRRTWRRGLGAGPKRRLVRGYSSNKNLLPGLLGD